MTVRAVEWKKPYTWGKGIEIDENKVISLRLRDENNLIIWDEWDNEIYVDLQLDDEIRPTDAFPVWITTGRVIIDNGWDKTWTLICAKTTSGDNIKIFYSDDGHLYVDHWTWLFTQVYLKPEVDALLLELRNYVDTELAKKQDKLIAGQNITIDQNNEISVDYSWTAITISSGNATLTDTRCKLIPTGNFTLQAPSTVSEGQEYVLRCENTTVYTMTLGTGFTNPHNVDLTLSANATDQFIFLATPSWDLELQPSQPDLSNCVKFWNNTLSSSSFISGSYSYAGFDYTSTLDADKLKLEGSKWNIDVELTLNWNAITRIEDNNWTATTETFWFLDWAWANKVARLKDIPSYTASTWISINANNEISNTLPWAIKSSTAPSNPSQWDQWYDTTNDELKIYDGSAWNAVGGGWDVWVSTQANNVFTPWMKIWWWTSANYANLTPDWNTAYLII